jgi:hypothetical protein
VSAGDLPRSGAYDTLGGRARRGFVAAVKVERVGAPGGIRTRDQRLGGGVFPGTEPRSATRLASVVGG